MAILQGLLLSGVAIFYAITRKSGRRPATKYKIYDAERYFDRDRKDVDIQKVTLEKNAGTGEFIDDDSGDADPAACFHSSSRGMSLPAHAIGYPLQTAAEQQTELIIRDDSIR
jgi:hypothetical protein